MATSRIKDIVISPPFGNYVCPKDATRIRGSFTIERRKGIIRQAVKTIRPIKSGWVNKMGLRNCGIKYGMLRGDPEKDIYSLAIVSSPDEWDLFLEMVPEHFMVEVNVGCPNVAEHEIKSHQLTAFAKKYKLATLKVPGVYEKAWDYIEMGYEEGFRYFHICNTIPVARGGESGAKVQTMSLPLITATKATYGDDVTVIGGGGIYAPEDVRRYRDHGADIFSLASIWFTPWRVPAVLEEIRRGRDVEWPRE